MTFDAQTAFMGLLGLVSVVLGWLGRELWSAVQAQRRDLKELEVRVSTDIHHLDIKVSNEFVRYDRLQDAMRPVMQKLERIEDALNKKVDK